MISTESLNSTPLSSRRQIAIFGSTNAGKSSLFNLLLNQEMSIVSEHHGTTTDPVVKAMELIGYGPIALIDTAGMNDTSDLGEARIKRSRQFVRRCDIALYLIDAVAMLEQEELELAEYNKICLDFDRYKVPHLLVFSKGDRINSRQRLAIKKAFPTSIISGLPAKEISGELFNRLTVMLQELDAHSDNSDLHPLALDSGSSSLSDGKQQTSSDRAVIQRLVEPGKTVLMVVPIDSEAPRGRLILPQVQLIRECLDHGVRCLVCRDTELAVTIKDYCSAGIDLVVTDSQAFGPAASIVPSEIPLTSFSMLLAAGKGDFSLMIQGLNKIPELKKDSRILISEACSHNTSHEDIGRVKIPAMLQRIAGSDLDFHFCAGQSYPDNLSEYSLVVHCGGCMITNKTMLNRIRQADDDKVAITNYGLLLAYGNGILDRSIEIFKARGLL